VSLRRRENEGVSIAFLDVITCGFGAIILLLMIAKIGTPPEPDEIEDPRAAQISSMQRDLFASRTDAAAAEAVLVAKQEQLATWQSELSRMTAQLNGPCRIKRTRRR
jgi:hypothetical protein